MTEPRLPPSMEDWPHSRSGCIVRVLVVVTGAVPGFVMLCLAIGAATVGVPGPHRGGQANSLSSLLLAAH